MFCNLRQHLWADHFVVMEAEHIGSTLWMFQLDVGTALGDYDPAFSQKRAEHDLRFNASPLAHAETRGTLIVSGISLSCRSTSSAIA